MSWVSDYKYSWYENLALNLISAGGTPYHVAFVMDGNRRYAKSEHLRQIEGHSMGFRKLADCLRWCLDLGIRKVTVFAFSIENFKRSEEEINDLLDLAREKFTKLLEDKHKLAEHGVRINVIGNLELLPLDLQELFARSMLETQSNDQLYLNIAFSYTSRDEMTQAVETVLKYGNDLESEDIDEHLLQELLYDSVDDGPELLIRSSGETRLSDFLMWQTSKTVLYFTKNLWPQVTIWNLLSAILTYQRSKSRRGWISCQQTEHGPCTLNKVSKFSSIFSSRVVKFLEYMRDYRKTILSKMSTATK